MQNLKQAKQHFTELTGLTPNLSNIVKAINTHNGTVKDWLSYGLGKYPDTLNLLDTRTKLCWISLVEYLQLLISFGGNK